MGKGVSFNEKNHPSICKIKENMNPELSFNFSETEEHKVGKIIVKKRHWCGQNSLQIS